MSGLKGISMMGLLLVVLLAPAPAAAVDFWIEGASLDTDQPLPGQDLYFQALIEGEADSVRLYYQLDGGGYAMELMGLDKSAKSEKEMHIWEYRIIDPLTDHGTVVDWYIEATHLTEPNTYAPEGAPAITTSETIIFHAEAFGLYFHDDGLEHEFDSTSPGQAVNLRICMRYPNNPPPAKTMGTVYAWDLQLRFAGAVTIGEWSYTFSGTNAGKSYVADKNGDTIVPFLVTMSLPYQSLTNHVIELAKVTLNAAGIDDQVSIYIEPRAGTGNTAPRYQAAPAGSWRDAGTSSGGDPNDEFPNWSVPCAQINQTGVIRDTAETWGNVKALYR